MMHSTNNDANDDSNPLKRQINTSPIISNSSPQSCATLLVIDDTSDSEDVTVTTSQDNDQNIRTKTILNKSIPTNITAQMSNTQISINLVPPTHDLGHDTIEQKRRRNSSIAKILGGHPLHNQQYEEIHQQILESQSAHNMNNNSDTTNDNDIQRSRSSITRTLLQNTEQTNNAKKVSPVNVAVPTGPSFSKDFEYLIRHEIDKVDTEHGSSRTQRNNSSSAIVPNIKSPNNLDAQLKLKRKRTNPKPSLPLANIPPFSLHNPSDFESTTSNRISSEDPRSNQYLHLDPIKRPRYLQQQQAYPQLSNHSSYLYHNNPTIYNQFNIHPDPTPPLSPSSARNDGYATSLRKTKSMLGRPDAHERSRQRVFSNHSEQSEPSSKATVPLKKRLLDAYNNEHPPTSSL